MIDINKMIKTLEEFNASLLDYTLFYRKDGNFYKIKLSIEVVDEESEEEVRYK